MILAVSEGSPICIVLCGGSWCTVWPWHATASSVCSSSGPATCTTAVAVIQRFIQWVGVRLRYERWVRFRYNVVDTELSGTRVLWNHSAHVAGIALSLSHSTLWMTHAQTQPRCAAVGVQFVCVCASYCMHHRTVCIVLYASYLLLQIYERGSFDAFRTNRPMDTKAWPIG